MKIIRYINGEQIKENELQKITVECEVIVRAVKMVNNRMNLNENRAKMEKSSG